MNKRTKDSNPTKVSPKYSMTPTGYRDLWACALSPWEILQGAGESPDPKFLGSSYVLEYSEMGPFSGSFAAMRAIHGQLNMMPGTKCYLTFRAVHDLALAFQPPVPFIHCIQPYSTGPTELPVFPHLS